MEEHIPWGTKRKAPWLSVRSPAGLQDKGMRSRVAEGTPAPVHIVPGCIARVGGIAREERTVLAGRMVALGQDIGLVVGGIAADQALNCSRLGEAGLDLQNSTEMVKQILLGQLYSSQTQFSIKTHNNKTKLIPT